MFLFLTFLPPPLQSGSSVQPSMSHNACHAPCVLPVLMQQSVYVLHQAYVCDTRTVETLILFAVGDVEVEFS